MAPTGDPSDHPLSTRLIHDIGGAFALGAVGGGAYHFLTGLHNAPNGARLAGALLSARMNAARVGGSFAVWRGLFSAFEISLVHLRRREDRWTPILAGAATFGLLSLRRGPAAVASSALLGGVIMAAIESVGKNLTPGEGDV